MSYDTNLLPCCFQVRTSSRTQVAPLETTHQVFIKRLSYASSSVGLGKVKKHKTLSLPYRDLSFSQRNRTHTHESAREQKGQSVLCSQIVGHFVWLGQRERESSLCTKAA